MAGKLIAGCLIGILLALPASEAATHHVPADFTTIQQAIDGSALHDTVLVAPGTYRENINFHGHNIVVAGNFMLTRDPADIAATIINGSQPANPDTGSCVRLVSGEDSTTVLEGFTITGGSGTPLVDQINQQTYVEGGGIMLENSSANILHNIITGNHADRHPTGITSAGGGGIRAGFGSPRIIGNVIMRNTGHYGGGVVINYANAVVRNNVICQNSGGQDFGGAGLWMYGVHLGAYSSVDNNTIVGNSSFLDGGGCYIWSASVQGRNNIVWGNRASHGAAQVSSSSGSLTFNYADVQGGFGGTGNLDSYPMFADTDLVLRPGSPCIDAGDPDPAYNDPDGTRGDLGALGGPLPHVIEFATGPSIATSVTRLSFGVGGVGVPANAALTVFNRGSGPLRIDSLKIVDPQTTVSLQNTISRVDPFWQDTLHLVWQAMLPVALQDTLRIYHNDPATPNPMNVVLVGTMPQGVDAPRQPLPSAYDLRQNFPNPFNPQTEIRFDLPAPSHVTLEVFDTLGRLVTTLVDEHREAGAHAVVWQADSEPSGTYLCRIRAGEFEKEIKMVLLK